MADWRNRVVERKRMRVGDLAINRYNNKSHPRVQQERLQAVLDKFGIVGDLVAYYSERNEGKLTLFDGHARQGLDPDAEWEVGITDLVDSEVDELVLYFDPLAALARIEADKTAALMADLDVQERALREMLEEQARELGFKFGGNGKREGEPPDPEIDRSQEFAEKWGTALGQVWELGAHQLVCGDCTDEAVVNAVAFGSVDLIVTDPPYGVSYADKNEYLNAVAKGNRIQTPIENDHLSADETAQKIWLPAFRNLYGVAKPGCVYYINAPQGGDLMMMMMALKETGWLLKPQIIWVKNNHVLGRSDYQLKHEPILYGWKPGAGHYWIGSRSEMSTWEINKPVNSDLHPTEKPLELVEKAIRNSSRQGEIVADFFSGSGTTLVGCEELGRRCFAIDIDPAYVAVTLERWHQLTGLDPRLVE